MPLKALFFLLLCPSLLYGKLELSSLLTDSAILQRDTQVPVYGKAVAGEKVNIAFAEQVKSTTATSNGTWMITLDAVPASLTSRIMTVTAGEESLRSR